MPTGAVGGNGAGLSTVGVGDGRQPACPILARHSKIIMGLVGNRAETGNRGGRVESLLEEAMAESLATIGAPRIC